MCGAVVNRHMCDAMPNRFEQSALGGVRSMASAQLAPAADHLLVVAPDAGPVLGPGGRLLELRLNEEIRRWERRTGGRAHVIRPNAAIAGLVGSPLHLFDKARFNAVHVAFQVVAARELFAETCFRNRSRGKGRSRGGGHRRG